MTLPDHIIAEQVPLAVCPVDGVAYAIGPSEEVLMFRMPCGHYESTDANYCGTCGAKLREPR